MGHRRCRKCLVQILKGSCLKFVQKQRFYMFLHVFQKCLQCIWDFFFHKRHFYIYMHLFHLDSVIGRGVHESMGLGQVQRRNESGGKRPRLKLGSPYKGDVSDSQCTFQRYGGVWTQMLEFGKWKSISGLDDTTEKSVGDQQLFLRANRSSGPGLGVKD